ncbi:MAG: PEP/pyruvate-binding domain-containing protein [Thermoleophilia bacterium]|jgi:pyruvate,water dikinase|nr:PEP/pyruvate-binding domain-containing protein [Thermoleophilia bacterium]
MNAPLPLVLPEAEVDARVAPYVGGKALALAKLSRAGLAVPPFSVVTTAAYEAFVDGPLQARILFELERKDVADMRWEEIWDAALRIRNLFLATPLPAALRDALAAALGARAEEGPVVVRSSAPGEDSAGASFAGLHESYVNVRGLDAILEHVRLVWASLWSDAALLYRRELGLDPLRSRMAVVVQEIVAGERSGVAFSRHPERDDQALVEAVHGLNQGLVDGTVEPDRWVLERDSGVVLEHHAATREEMVAPAGAGVRLVPLPRRRRGRPPLADDDLRRVHGLARGAEGSFAAPQDVEWTLRGEELFTLQSRPITTGGAEDDGRAAYLGLRRSYDSLVVLRRRIEDEALPAMAAEAAAFAAVALGELDDDALLAELERRKQAHDGWVDVYTRDFIPFAHAVRLFGQAYNDALRPDDPYEFVALLSGTPMLSTRRNAALAELAATRRRGGSEASAGELEAFLDEFGLEPPGSPGRERERATMAAVVERLASAPAAGPAAATGRAADRPATPAAGPGGSAGHATSASQRGPATPAPGRDDLERRFLEAAGGGDERERAAGLLDLARAGWRLRDDDNAYLDRIEAQLTAALEEAERRGLETGGRFAPRAVALPSPLGRPHPSAPQPAAAGPGTSPPGAVAKARQLVGQPAGPGVGVGTARVVSSLDDLRAFEEGEILVCDAIEPGMTFVVPLSAGIVERRGGMLIHGAIIAREYGLPCVTGVPGATELIHTGDRLTVDGYLGIVVVG